MIDTDPLAATLEGGARWDVAVPETSNRREVRQAYRHRSLRSGDPVDHAGKASTAQNAIRPGSYPIRKVTTPVPVEGGVAGGALAIGAGTSFHGRRNNRTDRRASAAPWAAVQDEAKHAMSAMSPLSPGTSRGPSPSGRCRTGRWCWSPPPGSRHATSRPRTARGALVAMSRRASTRWCRSRSRRMT